MLDIKLEKARIEDLQIINLYQRPDRAFREYFNGTDDEYLAYFNRHGINIHYVSENLYEAHTNMNNFLNAFKEAVNKDLSQFDFRIKSALGAKNLKELEIDDYMVLTINVNESTQEERQKFADIFFNTDSCSFCDFRDMDTQHTNHFQLIYNRRGIYEEKERIFVGKSKESVSLKEGFELAKDNNFVMADFFAKLAKAGVDDTFSFSYKSNGILKSMVATSQEILDSAKQKEDSVVINIKHEQIKEQAKAEIKQENALKRESLPKESTYAEITKEAVGTSFRPVAIDDSDDSIESATIQATKRKSNEKVTLENLDIVTEEVIDDYEQKELEKTKQRLAKSRAEGKKAYDYMTKLMEQGVGFLDAIKAAKQQFREDHTINFASILIQRDITKTTLLKEQVASKEQEIKGLNTELEKQNEVITKREETINSLKSTLEKSRVEFKLEKEELIEQHKVDLEELTASAKAEIDEITATSQKKINELTETINDLEEESQESQELLTRNSVQISNLTKENEELKATEKAYNQLLAKYELLDTQFAKINTTISEINAEKEKIARENISLGVKNENLQEKINEKETELTKNKENLSETLKKYDILTEKFANVEELKNKEISELKDLLEKITKENEALKAKLEKSTPSKEKEEPNEDLSKKRVLDILNGDDDDDGDTNKNVKKHKS